MTRATLSTTDQPPEQIVATAPPRKRGLLWFALLLIIAGLAGYAVWRAGRL